EVGQNDHELEPALFHQPLERGKGLQEVQPPGLGPGEDRRLPQGGRDRAGGRHRQGLGHGGNGFAHDFAPFILSSSQPAWSPSMAANFLKRATRSLSCTMVWAWV